MTTDLTFDASIQALAYSHQVRSALLLAVQRDASTDAMSLKVIDDVTFDGKSFDAAADLFQHKHPIKTTGVHDGKTIRCQRKTKAVKDHI